MCEADAFLWKNGQEEKILESVDIVRVKDGEVKLINIFGEQKTIRGVLKRYQNRPGKIVFEPA
ncbi:MAG: CooT family nickel-binding protein [Desulfobacteraceae bacterium]|jgi:predicted RNA-binding protein